MALPPNPFTTGNAGGAGATVMPGSVQDPAFGNPYVNPRGVARDQTSIVPGSGTPGRLLNRAEVEPGESPWKPGVGGQTAGEIFKSLLDAAETEPTKIMTSQMQLIKAGFLNPRKAGSFTPGVINEGDETYNAFFKLIAVSETTGKDYNKVLMDRVKKNPGARNYEFFVHNYGANGDGVKAVQDVTRTRTDVSSDMSAEGIVRAQYQQTLGRDPSKGEIAAFTAALQSAQRANPTVNQSQYDPNTGGDKTSSVSGGMDSAAVGAFAQDYASTGGNQSEANTQSIHTYASAFEKLLKGGG